jgi:hypothetical protein
MGGGQGPAGACAADLVCGDDDVCQTCGAEGEACCGGFGAACNEGLACGDDDLCAACGADGEQCCPAGGDTPRCEEGSTCVLDNSDAGANCHADCGAAGEPCCEVQGGDGCLGPLECNNDDECVED